jgi:catechol 2,3-dioxygenase-like lactoylglutathione lyase family enzyme
MSNAVQAANAVVGLDLAGVLVADPARSIAFYRDVLGMAPTGVDDEGRGAEFTLADGSTFAVWTGEMFGKKSGACPMLAVNDITAAVATFRERGLELSDVSESPVCWMSFGEDPDGNSFIIHQRKTPAAQ